MIASGITRLAFDALMRKLDQQSRVAEIIATQAEAMLSPLQETASLQQCLDELNGEAGVGELLEMHVQLMGLGKSLLARQHDLCQWIHGLADEANAHLEQVMALPPYQFRLFYLHASYLCYRAYSGGCESLPAGFVCPEGSGEQLYDRRPDGRTRRISSSCTRNVLPVG